MKTNIVVVSYSAVGSSPASYSCTCTYICLIIVCSFYEVGPTGGEDIGDSSCIGGCDYCIHENSQDARKCLQLQLLLQATVSWCVIFVIVVYAYDM